MAFNLKSYFWWLALAMLMVTALIIYWTGYNTGFEVNDQLANSFDETWLYQEAFEMTRLPENERRLAGYPPGTLWFMQLAHRLVGNPDVPRPIETLNLVRLWAGVFNVATVVMIALTARRLHSPLTGLIAATGWLMAPLIVLRVRYALTEPFQAFFVILAVYFALLALVNESPRAAVASVIAGLTAVMFKYSVFSVLGFGTGVTLWFLVRHGFHTRRWQITLLVQGVAIVLCAGWLFLIYGATNLTDRPEIANFVTSDLGEFILSDYLRAFVELAGQNGFHLLIFVALLAAGSVLFVHQKSNPLRYFWLMSVMFVCAHLTLMLFYIVYWLGVHRYTTPTTPVVVLLLSLSLVLTGQWVLRRIKIHNQIVQHAVLLVLAALWIAPMAQQTISDVQERSVPRIEMPFASWMGDALPTGTIIMPEGQYLWRHTDIWFGYDGPLRPWVTTPLTAHSREEWQEMFVEFAYLADWQRDSLLETLEGRAYLDALLPLKHFPPASDPRKWRGETFTVYYLGEVEYRTETVFGQQIALYGYTLDISGDAITVQPFWQAVAPPQANYTVFVHLVPQNTDKVMAQDDRPLARPTYPPMVWTDFDEIIIGQPLNVTLPDDSGTYRVIMGLYDPDTLERLITTGGDNYVTLYEMTIE